jgi:hypothetical protein
MELIELQKNRIKMLEDRVYVLESLLSQYQKGGEHARRNQARDYKDDDHWTPL